MRSADEIQGLERRLLGWHRQDQASQQLATIPGIGIITATAPSAGVTDPGLFRSGRAFAALLGLVPRQNSSGGKDRLGRISEMGDSYLRKLLFVGATSVIHRARTGASASGGGSTPCSNSGRRTSSRSPWPTRTPASSGPC